MLFIGRLLSLIVLLYLWSFLILPLPGHAQDCQEAKDWKDIYVLPTNPNPQSNIKISVSSDKTRAQPGEHIVITFQADRECYLTLMDMGTSGRIIRLWPNEYSGSDNRIQPNSPRKFPGPQDSFKFQIAGPDGTERIIAYATSEKGKILTEQEFRSFQSSGFKEYLGGARDLADQFEKNTASLPSAVTWGTAQVNVCIGSGSQPQPPAATGPGKMYVLALGGQYKDLKYPMQDARTFVDTIKRKMHVPESNVRLILGGDVSYQSFVSGINWLASHAHPEDTAVVYYSGHGGQIPDQPPLDEADGKDEVFVFPINRRDRPDWRTAINEKLILVDDEFNVLMKKVPARKKIIVVDACHSGTIDKMLEGDEDELVSKYYPLLDPDTGKEMWGVRAKSVPTNYGNDNEALLSSCLDSETSFESPRLKGGVFTHFLVKAVNEGSPDLERAFQKAKELTIKHAKEGQRPNKPAKSQTPSLTDPHGLTKLFKFSR